MTFLTDSLQMDPKTLTLESPTISPPPLESSPPDSQRQRYALSNSPQQIYSRSKLKRNRQLLDEGTSPNPPLQPMNIPKRQATSSNDDTFEFSGYFYDCTIIINPDKF
eukprot:TRINITY_DN8221_c0_g1_i1.p1 TRINITY_DN8221_c0_g1~~TRINITY_DN8221_c0_g1_i1.p1  ORF type:complete len:122 (-),score=31.21 TRINITY_DN8221_c0_g1_i1:252-575(-)